MQNHTQQTRQVQIAHAMQQRQILAQMGVDGWVDNNTFCKQPPVLMDELLLELQNYDEPPVSASQSISLKHQEEKVSSAIEETTHNEFGKQLGEPSHIDFAILDVAESMSLDETANPTTTGKKIDTSNLHESNLVVPFELQGISFGDWVILVDADELSEKPETEQLWQNIANGLRVSIQNLKFPLASHANSTAFANSALGGFIFRLFKEDNKHQLNAGSLEKIKLAALTVMPNGVEDKRFLAVPTLTQMLADPSKKRVLWQTLQTDID